MKKFIVFLTLVLCIFIQTCRAESNHQTLIFFNEDSNRVKVYENITDCINNSDTKWYIFNGFCGELQGVYDDGKITRFKIGENTYYVLSRYLSNIQIDSNDNYFLKAHCGKGIRFVDINGTEEIIPPYSTFWILGYVGKNYVGKNLLVHYNKKTGIIQPVDFDYNDINPECTKWILLKNEAISIAMDVFEQTYGTINPEYKNMDVTFNINPYLPDTARWTIYLYKTEHMETEAYYLEINGIDGEVIDCYFGDDFSG